MLGRANAEFGRDENAVDGREPTTGVVTALLVPLSVADMDACASRERAQHTHRATQREAEPMDAVMTKISPLSALHR